MNLLCMYQDAVVKGMKKGLKTKGNVFYNCGNFPNTTRRSVSETYMKY